MLSPVSLWFTTMAATALIAGGPSPPPAYVAPCPSGVSGGLSRGYERQSLLAGPLALFPAGGGYADYPARFIVPVRRGARRYPPFEAVATVRPGGDVTLAIAPADRAHVGFLFDPASWANSGRGYRVADGETAVRFRGCTAPYTQYQGGFVIDGPRCATLEIWLDGATAPERHVVSFGAGDCG